MGTDELPNPRAAATLLPILAHHRNLEVWAWMHWLLQTTPLRRDLLQAHLAHTRAAGSAPPLSQVLHRAEPLCHHALVQHLMALHDETVAPTPQ